MKERVEFKVLSKSEFVSSVHLANGNATKEDIEAALKNGVLSKEGIYNALIMQGGKEIVIELTEAASLYVAGGVYSDSGGNTGAALNVYKLIDGSYALYHTIGDTSVRAFPLNTLTLMMGEMEAGTYKFKANGSYVAFNEFYFEKTGDTKFLLQSQNNFFTIKDNAVEKVDDIADKRTLFSTKGFESLTKKNCETIAKELGKCKVLKAEV